MAKALLGYTSSIDPRVHARAIAENRKLRQRVADLEAQIARMQAEKHPPAATAHDSPLLTLEKETVQPVDESMQPA